MRRRRLLSTIATGLLAGCLGGNGNGNANGTSTSTSPPTTTGGATNDSPVSSAAANTSVASTPTPATPSSPPTEESIIAEAPEAPFELTGVDYPRTIEVDQEVTFAFTVRNAASRPQSFTATVGIEYTTDSKASTPHPPTSWGEASIPPGETRTFESPSMTFPYLGTVRFRLVPFGRRFITSVTTRQLTFRDQYRLDSGALIDIAFDRRTDEYTFTRNGERHTVEASTGRQWVFATVTAENPTDSLRSIPPEETFSLVIPFVGRYEHIDEDRKDGGYIGGKLQSGATREGWVLFEAPETERLDDFEFTYRRIQPAGVTEAAWATADHWQS
ncbi:MAG: DUF4352 domain-containing protein [Halobacteriales archaeon]